MEYVLKETESSTKPSKVERKPIGRIFSSFTVCNFFITIVKKETRCEQSCKKNSRPFCNHIQVRLSLSSYRTRRRLLLRIERERMSDTRMLSEPINVLEN